MRVFKPKYRNRQNALRPTRAWYVQLSVRGKVHRIPGFTDKGATAALGKKLERLAELRASGSAPDPELLRWIESLELSNQKRLLKMGLLEPRRLAGARGIDDLLDEWLGALRARGRTEKWIDLVVQRARITLTGCGFAHLTDLDAAAIERRLHALREGAVPPPKRRGSRGRPPRSSISIRESNHRLQACKEFTRWAAEQGLLQRDPLAILKPLNARLDPRHVRRALRPEELRRLVTAAEGGPTIRGVTGQVRALAWRLGCEAGLRIGEVFALQVGDVDLDADGGPTLTIRAAVSKNRTEARLPLHPALARDLAPFVRAKFPTASVLELPPPFKHMAPFWLKHDLKAAGIPYEDDAGRKADVHSLRSSFITALVRSGANVKAVQRLARHASPVETVGIYTRLDPEDERDALLGLASVASGEGDEQRATGTDGGAVLPTCLPKHAASQCDQARLGATTNRIPAPERAVSEGSGGKEWRGRRDLNPQPPA